MRSIHRCTHALLVVVVVFALGACSGMSQRDKNTAVGA